MLSRGYITTSSDPSVPYVAHDPMTSTVHSSNYHIIRSICTIRCTWPPDLHCALKQILQRRCIPTSIARLCSWYQSSCDASSFLSADAVLFGRMLSKNCFIAPSDPSSLECMGCDHRVRCLRLSLLDVMIDCHASRSMCKSDSLSFQIVFWSVPSIVGISLESGIRH